MFSMNFWFFLVVMTILGGAIAIGWFVCMDENDSDTEFYKKRYHEVQDDLREKEVELREIQWEYQKLEEQLSKFDTD